MRGILAVLSILFLSACLVFPILRFLGVLSAQNFKVLFFLASCGWFAGSLFWQRNQRRKKS